MFKPGIEALRRLHRAADKAVRRAVVWAPLAAAVLGGASFARAASRAYLNITVRVNGITSITDLSAVQAASSGTVSLSWTEPYHATGTPPFSYDVRVSTVGQIANDTVFSTSPLLSVFSPSAIPSPGAGGGAAAFTVAGLSGGVTYYFAIREKDSGALNGSWLRTLAPALNVNNYAVPFSTTPAPVGGIVTSLSTTTITATWGVAPSATDYVLVTSTRAALPPSPIWASSSTASSTATVSGLFPNTTYFMFVSACGVGCSPFASIGPVVTVAAPAVSLTTTSALATSVGLNWSPNGNSAGTRYLIEMSTDGVSFSTAPPSLTTTTVVAGLSPATTYYFAVVAQNFAGVLASTSNVVTAVTGVQQAPAAGFVTAVSTFSLDASWSVAVGATDYVLVVSTKSAVPPVLIAGSSTTLSSTATVAGLVPNTTYFAFVSACGAGCSPFLAMPSTVTLAASAVSLSTTAVSSTTVALTWSPDGNPAGTKYLVELSTDGVSFSTAAASVSTSAVVRGLTSANTYYFAVVAQNFAGVLAGPSDPVIVVTPSGAPLAPSTGSFVSVTASSITATWAVSLGATDYLLVASTSSALPPLTVSGSSTTLSSTATVSGLMPNASYYVFVAACGSGCSPFTALGSTYTLAASAVALSSTSLSSSTIGLVWSPNGNPAGTVFLVEQSTDGVNYATILTSTASAAQLGGLTGGGTYYFEVVSVNGAGVQSAPSNVLFIRTPILTPAAPTGVAAGAGLLSVSLTWNALPAGKQGVGLAEYRVLRSTNAGYGFAEVATASGTAVLDKILPAGVTQYYQIVARDLAGTDGPPSATVSATPFTMIPMEPIGLQVAPSSGTITISWTPTSRFFDGTPFVTTGAPNADELQGYSVFRATDVCAPSYVQVSSLSITTTSLTDYTGGLNYYYRLFSYNSAGVSTNTVTLSSLGEFQYFVDDCVTNMALDAGTAAQLAGAANGVGDVRIVGVSRPQDETNGTFKSVEWNASVFGGGAIKNFVLPKPGRVVLGFDTANGAPVPSAAAKGRASGLSAAAGPAVSVKDLGVFWNNGLQFVKMYGKIDPVGQTVSVESPNMGVYQIRAQARSAGAVFDVSNLSSRVITPNGDGLNDTLIFTYDPGPNNVTPEGRIFDLRGGFVSFMTPGLVPNTLTWNGFMNGVPVHSGVYVYRITGDGKIFTGTIVVAR
jgi:hypothetical protein